MVKSYFMALMMILLLGSMKTGLLSMLPNLIPILITLGIMGFMDAPLNINSMLIGSIALGIVVDDTVHFIYNVQKFYDKCGDPFYAVKQTLLGVADNLSRTLFRLFYYNMFLLKASAKFRFFYGYNDSDCPFSRFFLVPAILIMVNPRQAVIKVESNL